jgi:predicted enzyme related to lactoylglutathione lyase
VSIDKVKVLGAAARLGYYRAHIRPSDRGLSMYKIAIFLVVIGAVIAMASAQADTTLNGVRVGAKDVAALAKFYQAAFGMHEVQRISMPNMLEIMLNFGATDAAAKANPGSQVVIMQRANDDGKDTMPHVIFNVTDIAAVVKTFKAAGGKMQREVFEFEKSGIMIGMLIDPAGNHVELLQFPKR